MAKEKNPEAAEQYVGAQPTKQKPGEDPDAVNPERRDDEGHFVAKGKPTQGVQPVEDDDIPEAGR